MMYNNKIRESSDIENIILPIGEMMNSSTDFDYRKIQVRFIVDLILIGDRICSRTDWNNAVSPEDKVLLTLRYYATGSMLIVCGDFIGIHKSTASRIVKLVSHNIAILRSQFFVNFPNNENDFKKVKQDFYNIAKFPTVIGALDCTHVKIKSPGGDNAEVYRNRKNFFSINVQTICDANLKIQDIVARWPGSSHDSTIFNNSEIRRKLEIWRNEATGINVKITSSQSTIVATAVLHNIACNFGESVPRVTTKIESLILITEFNNPGEGIGRNAANITRNKFLRYFNNLI
ncbi:unnamed protein product [Macrosiphum euphorbiae]|uniref:DDE Tnp4 domain-containing protein n=1 Tax=Macrosiphum euphorbiae TaxID=13131 RepID=A0AAV0YBD8_9HEMI|nr:unnamed protein product [Macrosiphum euphorbiae]